MAAPRKLRILHSVGYLSRGGIEGWLYEIIRTLDAERFEHHVMVWTADIEAFTMEYRAAGAKVHPMAHYKNPVLFRRVFHDLVSTQGPFDVVHTHGTHYHGFIMLLARLARIKVRIAHSHTDIRPLLARSGRGYRLYASIGHHAIRSFATAGLAVSDDAGVSMFGPQWHHDPRWHLLFCGIDLAPFAALPMPGLRTALGIPIDRFVIGHVGRFEEQKNHSFLLDIATVLVRRQPNAHFLLIGDGSLRQQCIETVEQRGISSHFTFLRDCRTVPQHMISAMDVFVFPSHYEGLPLVAIEAQAAGLPCLMATSVSEETAFIAALAQRLPLSAGAEAWANAVLTLPPRVNAANGPLRQCFAQSHFNIQQSASALASFYDNALWQDRNATTRTRE